MSLNRNTTINLLKVLATALVFCQHSTIICNDELGFILTGFYQQFLNVPAQGGMDVLDYQRVTCMYRV